VAPGRGLFWGSIAIPFSRFWTALDDAPIEGGCVEVVPGSHKAGLATPLGGVFRRSTCSLPERKREACPFR